MIQIIFNASNFKISSLSKNSKFKLYPNLNNAFLSIQAYGDVEKVKEDRRTFGISRNVRVQPYIIVVGDKKKFSVESVYVIIDNIEYAVDSVLKALDVCFKAFNVFNAAYTSQSEQIWLLLQVGLYRFRTKFDARLNCVDEVLHDMGLNIPRV